MSELTSVVSRVLFGGSFVLATLAATEKLANMFRYTVISATYTPWRLLEFAAVMLMFVFALQLREIRHALATRGRP